MAAQDSKRALLNAIDQARDHAGKYPQWARLEDAKKVLDHPDTADAGYLRLAGSNEVEVTTDEEEVVWLKRLPAGDLKQGYPVEKDNESPTHE